MGTLALVVAHPDDDAYGLAGTVALHAADPDHITVGAATDAAFARSGGQRLLHRVLPQSVFDRWQRQRRELGLPVFDPGRIYHGRGVPDDEVAVTVDCSSVSDRVVAGILEHRSQLHVMADQPIDLFRLRRIVSREWAAMAWPPRPAGAGMLADVFEGLD